MNIDFYANNYHIRSITPSDKIDFMRARILNSDYKEFYQENSQLIERSWKETLKCDDEIHMMVYIPSTSAS